MFATAGCGSSSSGTPTVSLKFGHDSPINHPYQVGAQVFKDYVEKETDGRVKVNIFPNAQLGDESTMINGLKVGAVDAMWSSTQPITQSVPEAELFDLPFLFPSVEAAVKVANSDVGQGISQKINTALGARVLAWGSIGERDMWNSKRPIRSPEDLHGIKMRIQTSKLQEATYKALGALPTPMSFSELFTSLQTHVVDGADPGPVDIQAEKFYQVAKYLTLTRHFEQLTALLISDRAMEKLSAADQAVVKEGAKKAAEAEISALVQSTTEALAYLKQHGMQVVDLTPEERQVFIDASKPVYQDALDSIGGASVLARVQELAGQ